MQPLPTTTPAIRALLLQAVDHHRAGRLAEAEQLYRKVLQTEPREPDANHNLGLIALAVGRRDVALPLLQQALSANPMQPQFIASLVGLLLDIGRDAEARAILQHGFGHGVRNPALETLFLRAEAARGPNRPQPEDEAALLHLFELGMHGEIQQNARRL
ncbi:MAG: tetratricopeptide repeat protein, partial [Burkholderiaceae bacterium]|nr:tetratricopeptide repeat protein [Burkholderiaceae bacterium]